MREILFRGKSVNDGEWVHGSLVITTIEPADDAPYKYYRIDDMTVGVFPNDFQCGLSEIVAPETVGQYTGLTDKNGKKIFEGDIIKTRHGIRYITFVDGCFGAKPNIRLFADLRQYNRELNGEWEIVGNIHDNPELLGGADNGE